MTDYVLSIMHLVPDAKISYSGLDVSYEDIEWNDERTQPTKAECEQAYPQAKYEYDYAVIEAERKSRYEKETDGLFFDAMRTDQILTEWIAAVEAIKADLPYPTEPS